MMRLAVAVLGAAVLLLGVPAGMAWGQQSGAQRFTIVCSGSAAAEQLSCRVAASGVVNASGRDITTSETTDVFVFPAGRLFVSHTETNVRERVDETACVGRFSFRGTWEITGGTGAYEGASGSGRHRGQGAFVAARSDGACSEEDGRVVVTVRLTGTLTLPA